MTSSRGLDVIHDPLINKGTGFTMEERERLGLRGLVPPMVEDKPMDSMLKREMGRFNSLTEPLDKYRMLAEIGDRNKALFYRLLSENLTEMAPIVYTPTVGLACQQFGAIFSRSRGMYFSSHDAGHMQSMVYNWPGNDVRVIVVTDGSRILGLGDLGANGMGIPIGKLHLYTAIGGIHPSQCLPIQLDFGTNREELWEDEFYLGIREPRKSGDEYMALVDEFIQAVLERWPKALVQFEDFSNEHAEKILNKYRGQVSCFNDDIQGTGAVALAGALAALRATGNHNKHALKEQKICILGAGSAGLGIANALLYGMVNQGLTVEEAANMFYLVDDKGLLTDRREDSTVFQSKFLRKDLTEGMSLLDTVATAKPSMIIGVTGCPGLFTEDVIREMGKHHERPIVFPLSNPTSRAECSAEEAFTWTEGRAIVASGSPFEPVTLPDGKVCYASQANNMWTFPAIGLGAVTCNAEVINRRMLYSVSEELASLVSQSQLDKGMVFPEMSEIPEVTEKIAIRLVKEAYELGVAREPIPHKTTIEEMVRSNVWKPKYPKMMYSNHKVPHLM